MSSQRSLPSRTSRVASSRRGAVLVLSLFLLVVMLGFIALAIDIGYLAVSRTEAQSSADAAAIAAAWELMSQEIQGRNPLRVRGVAAQFAAANKVGRISPEIGHYAAGDVSGDFAIGKLDSPWSSGAPLRISSLEQCNAVQVRVKRTAGQNGEVSLFFAPIFGVRTASIEAEATAAFVASFRGFRPPKGHPEDLNIPLLPFAVPVTYWNDFINGSSGEDQWSFDRDSERVEAGSDGIRELNLYPLDTGSPGNFGTVDIGGSSSNTPKLRRQISQGISPEDVAYHGGQIALDERGELLLSADPGLKAVVEKDLQSILGQPRIIPLYRQIDGNGQQATYTIVGFAGVRIVEAELSGGAKRVMVQPATVVVRGGIPGDSRSMFIHSPVTLAK